MADPTAASLRVRVMADIADIKQGLAVVRGQVAAVRAEGGKTSGANVVNKLGTDAKDTSRVLAVLQPQITDIITSLQGGMSFTTVALQQGGQIRDVAAQMGIGIKDIGLALLSLVTPATLTAAALAAVGYAWYSAAKQEEAFDRAIATTGNRLGTTRDELEGMAEAIASKSSVASYGDAAEAIQAIATAGDVSVGAMQNVALSIVNMSQTSGASIDSLIATFAKLSEDPLAALDAVDKKANILTYDLYEQVKSLVELGRNYEAAAVIAQAAADKTAESLAKVDEALDGTTKMVHTAESAWHSFYIGLKQSLGMASRAEEIQVYMQQIASLQQQSTRIGLAGGDTTGYQVKIKEYTEKLKALGADSEREIAQARQQAQAEAADRQMVSADKLIDAQATKEVKKRKEIATFVAQQQAAIDTYSAQGDLANWTKAKKLLEDGKAAIEKKYAEKKTGSTATASRNAGLQQFENAADMEKARIEAQTKGLQTQYQIRAISASEYYTKLRALTVEGTDAQTGALEKEIAYLKARTGTGKDAIATTQKIGELEAKLSTVRTEGASKIDVLNLQEKALQKQREDAISSYTSALQSSTDALQAQMDAQVAHIGTGDRDYEIQQKLTDIYKEQAQRLTELALQKNASKIDPVTYDAEVEAVKNATEQRVSIVQNGYQRMAEAQGEWSNGAISAWVNYMDNAKNVAGQVESAMGSAFTGAEDALVNFVQTGKLSFTDLANSIIADLARIAAKQAITGMFGSVFNSVVGSTIGGVTKEAIPLTFAAGGYTGDGGKFDPAGIVHKGEGVIPQWGIAAMGGPAAFMGFLGDLRTRRGYAEGGMAGIAASAVSRSSTPNVQINIENNTGSQISAQAGDVKFDGEKWVIKIVASNIASGGAIAAAGKGRFGWKDQL